MKTWLILISLLISSSLLADSPSVGIEGALKVTLQQADLIPQPVDKSDDLHLRIENVSKTADGYLYDLRYTGRTPGSFNLRDYLVRRADGQRIAGEAIKVTISSVLPKEHKGELLKEVTPVPGFFGSYSTMMNSLWFLWALLLLPLWLWNREKKSEEDEAVAAYQPTLAERLQKLFKELDQQQETAIQARIEALLFQQWRSDLGLTDEQDLVAVHQQLKKHAEAGPLLTALESFLHAPGDRSPEQLQSILAPYQQKLKGRTS